MNISRLESRFQEIFVVAPNDLGHPWLTRIYKKLTRQLKTMPFVYIIPVSIALAIAMYMIGGFLTIRLVSLLQHAY